MLAELGQPAQHAPRMLRLVEMLAQFGRVGRQSNGLKHADNPSPGQLVEQADLLGVGRVQREPDGHGLAVQQAVPGQRLQLVRRPVAHVQGPRRAELERSRIGFVAEPAGPEISHGAGYLVAGSAVCSTRAALALRRAFFAAVSTGRPQILMKPTAAV